MYGTAYGNTDGYGTTNHFNCYTSTDLANWTACMTFSATRQQVYTRPHVIYNADTKKYVLWYNWYQTLWSGQYGVAVSDTPTGPFTVVNENVNMKFRAKGLGDLSLFVDIDSLAYLVYTTISDHVITVEKLAPDYLSSTLTNSGTILPSAEACSMFKRNGIYYVLSDKMCQFCPEGSGAQVFMASNPLGPYLYSNNINNLEKTKYPASATIDGDRKGILWGTSGGWSDNTIGYYPDILEISFNAAKSINEIDVFTLQDNVDNPVEPSASQIFTKYGITAFELQYWNGTTWRFISGSTVSGNNLVWRKIKFNAVTTSKIRIIVTDALDNFSRIVELEAYENGVNVAAKVNGGTAKASTEYVDASDNIIHAQQTHIAEIPTKTGTAYLWMADRWGSGPDGIKGHDFQFWSSPLVFNEDGTIQKLSFVSNFNLDLSSGNTELQNTSHAQNFNCYLDDHLQLVVSSTKNQGGILRILNVSGVSLLSKQLKINAGIPVKIDCNQFPKGVYVAVIENTDQRYTAKFVR
ncbi:MAG: family 43 glycosylhydrolase [Bacteroidales bacterium]